MVKRVRERERKDVHSRQVKIGTGASLAGVEISSG